MDKKAAGRIFVGILMLSLLMGSAYADTAYVYGVVYDGVDNSPIPGANVTVECDANGATKSTISNFLGNYEVLGLVCPINTTVTVSAVKGGMSGSAPGFIDDSGIATVGVAVVDVPVFAPEVVSLLAILAIAVPGFAYAYSKRRE